MVLECFGYISIGTLYINTYEFDQGKWRYNGDMMGYNEPK